MSTGKDPQSADGLGGIHKVAQPRAAAPLPAVPADAEPVVAARGPIPGADPVVDDPDQVTKVVHTAPAAVERVSPEEPSAWSAEKKPGD